MQADMVDLLGEAGSGEGDPGFGGGEPPEGGLRPPGGDGFPQGFEPPAGGERRAPPAGGRGPGPGDMTPENPMWVPATVEFEGRTWTDVGVRYKGNSSLASGWRSGALKLPLKLDFDEFEDEVPAIEDQRFYGFKQLSLANGFSDPSFLRDAATAGILQEAGLPAAETAFYEVILDYGQGPVSLGLYTLIEVVDDTVVERTFGSDDGNIYEAEGPAASFAASTRDRIEDSFEKENNRDQDNWSDLEALFDVLHDEQRTREPAAWRAELESIFDVEGFLEWLAISAAIEHWDAYGAMSHNYYLYHDPGTGRLAWISWDHNMAMSKGRGDPGGRGPASRSVSLDKAEVTGDWPLIRYLLDDPVYDARYLDYLAETVAGPFEPDHMAEVYGTMAELIAPYAAADVGQATFDAAVQELVDHAYQRAEAVEAFLSANGR
jgi:spore coat protein CotH